MFRMTPIEQKWVRLAQYGLGLRCYATGTYANYLMTGTLDGTKRPEMRLLVVGPDEKTQKLRFELMKDTEDTAAITASGSVEYKNGAEIRFAKSIRSNRITEESLYDIQANQEIRIVPRKNPHAALDIYVNSTLTLADLTYDTDWVQTEKEIKRRLGLSGTVGFWAAVEKGKPLTVPNTLAEGRVEAAPASSPPVESFIPSYKGKVTRSCTAGNSIVTFQHKSRLEPDKPGSRSEFVKAAEKAVPGLQAGDKIEIFLPPFTHPRAIFWYEDRIRVVVKVEGLVDFRTVLVDASKQGEPYQRLLDEHLDKWGVKDGATIGFAVPANSNAWSSFTYHDNRATYAVRVNNSLCTERTFWSNATTEDGVIRDALKQYDGTLGACSGQPLFVMRKKPETIGGLFGSGFWTKVKVPA